MSLIGCSGAGFIHTIFFSPLTLPCKIVLPGRGANRNSRAFFAPSAPVSKASSASLPNSMNRFGCSAMLIVSWMASRGLRTTSTAGLAALATRSRLRRRFLSTGSGRIASGVSSHRESTTRTSAQPSAMLCWIRACTAVVLPS